MLTLLQKLMTIKEDSNQIYLCLYCYLVTTALFHIFRVLFDFLNPWTRGLFCDIKSIGIVWLFSIFSFLCISILLSLFLVCPRKLPISCTLTRSALPLRAFNQAVFVSRVQMSCCCEASGPIGLQLQRCCSVPINWVNWVSMPVVITHTHTHSQINQLNWP